MNQKIGNLAVKKVAITYVVATIIWHVVMWLFIFLFVLPAHAAETGACYNIADSDARTYCLARAHREPSMCYSIKAAETRALCLAEVRK